MKKIHTPCGAERMSSRNLILSNMAVMRSMAIRFTKIKYETENEEDIILKIKQ